MTLKKLLLILGGLLLMTTLTACSTSKRAEFEKRFAKVGEIYPTKNVSDLFEKFPDGFHIFHTRYEYKEGTTYYHNIGVRGNSKTKQIKGMYEKSYFNNNEEIILFDENVEYTEKKGLQFISGEPMDPFMVDFQFAFEWFEINKEKLSKLELRGLSENPVSGGYGLYYYIEDDDIYNHFKIIPKNKLVISLNDYRLSDESKEGRYSIELSVFDIKKPENIDYFLESISAK